LTTSGEFEERFGSMIDYTGVSAAALTILKYAASRVPQIARYIVGRAIHLDAARPH
jgi:hypothetical protein